MNSRFILLPPLLLFFLVVMSCSESHSSDNKSEITYAAIARGKIDVEGGLLNIAAPPDARFVDINVQVGDNIKANDVLATLNSDQELLAVEMADAEIHHSQAELEVLNNQLKHTTLLAKRWSEAATAGAAEQQQADDAQQSLAQLNAEIAVSKAAIEINRIKRKQAQNILAQRTMRAPKNAKVIKVIAQKGTTLNADQNIAFILLPATPLIVRAEVNESFIGRIHQNSTASVSLESNPQAASIKAKVISVGATLDASHWSDEQQPGRVVECFLELEQQQHLLVGQNVMVKFNE